MTFGMTANGYAIIRELKVRAILRRHLLAAQP